MNLGQVSLDVDKALERPSILEIAEAIDAASGVEALAIVVSFIGYKLYVI